MQEQPLDDTDRELIEAARAVKKRGENGEDYPVLSPCGGCRQLIVDYAPKGGLRGVVPESRKPLPPAAEPRPFGRQALFHTENRLLACAEHA